MGWDSIKLTRYRVALQGYEETHLQILDAELVPVHVDGRQEDGLHLVVPKLIGRQVRGD